MPLSCGSLGTASAHSGQLKSTDPATSLPHPPPSPTYPILSSKSSESQWRLQGYLSSPNLHAKLPNQSSANDSQ